ncbi:unnamed protein product [Ilex paraguariensis]|uniref:Uncharacterized protein n=1 Tax=Ilex paraguariensis TaxID=185542 RepID=A0ABC8RAI8_9AQUA
MGFSQLLLGGGEFPPALDGDQYASISFRVPSVLNLKICGLNICVVYSSKVPSPNFMEFNLTFFQIVVSNTSLGLDWYYCPTFLGIPDDDTDTHIAWLSHWKFEGGQMEAEDDVVVQVFHNFDVSSYVEIQIVYDPEEQVIASWNIPLVSFQEMQDFLSASPIHRVSSSKAAK